LPRAEHLDRGRSDDSPNASGILARMLRGVGLARARLFGGPKQATLPHALDYRPDIDGVSTSKYLCDDARCHVIIGKKLMYRDTHHLSYGGDLYMGEQFAREQDARLREKR
jgi:hypothetical protein